MFCLQKDIYWESQRGLLQSSVCARNQCRTVPKGQGVFLCFWVVSSHALSTSHWVDGGRLLLKWARGWSLRHCHLLPALGIVLCCRCHYCHCGDCLFHDCEDGASLFVVDKEHESEHSEPFPYRFILAGRNFKTKQCHRRHMPMI